MQTKTLPPRELLSALEPHRRRGEKIVFTNGCFDILHVGHVRLLQAARRLGDLLVVGLNSDRSVREIKGPDRPINGEAKRAEVMAALAAVDFVTLFDEADPLELIKLLKPQVLVKGGDWKPEAIIGSDLVTAGGGKVVVFPYQEGDSTTGLVEAIRAGERGSG